MIIEVRLFARARDLAGADRVTVNLKSNATVQDLRQTLIDSVPALASMVGLSAISVNDEFADESAILTQNSSVALIPPVSGGEPGCVNARSQQGRRTRYDPFDDR
jgi:molybdopterin converting factor subunit 1